MIKCNSCKVEKLEEDFHRSSKRATGRQYSCKSCQAQTNLKRYHSKLSADLEYKDKKAAYDKDRRKQNGEELRAYDRERAKLPHRRAAHNEDTRKRRAKLKDAIPDGYDRSGVLSMYRLAQKFSKLTGVEMHVDHIIPIAVGGKHNTGNLQLLAGTLNILKGAKPHFQLSWKAYSK